MKNTTTHSSWLIQMGARVAAILSAVKFSGFWLIVGYFFCGWLYLFYYLLKYGWH